MPRFFPFFPSKRRRTDSENIVAEESTSSHFPTTSSTASLSTLAPNGSTAQHRRQHSTGSFKPGLPPIAPRLSAPTVTIGTGTTTRRRESNNNNHSNIRNGAGVSTSSNIPDLCTQSMALLDPENIRMVLIDVDSKCLYDTTTVIPIRNSTTIAKNAKNLSVCKKFELLKRRKDTRILTQLLFGAVPTESGSETFKIHILDDEEKILVSKTFYMPKPDRNKRTTSENQTVSSDSDSQMTIKSLDGWQMRTHVTRSTTSTPEQFTRVRHVSINLTEDESTADCSISSSCAPRAFSPPHRLSRNRRRQMAAKTSLSENGACLKSRSRLSSMNSSQTEDEHSNDRHVALGLLFPGAQRHFLFQHMPLIEAEMSRFEARMINIGQNPPSFFINTHNAWNDFVNTICCLHNAPRLRNPVWLSLNEHVDEEKIIAKQFCDQLAYLLKKYETKETGYFFSNLVSTILMHHMSWVASVASPPLARNDRQIQKSTSMLFGMATNEDAHALGYNAHMAQYLELSGSCGPHRSAKTVICGDDAELMSTICQVLSFFIRCSAVQHVDEDKIEKSSWELPIEQAFSPIDDDDATLGTSPIEIPSPPTEDKSSDEDRRSFVQHQQQRRKLRREAATQPKNTPNMMPPNGSPSSSVDSLPSVVTQTAAICVIADDNVSAITIIDRIEYPPCCDHHSTTDDEDTASHSDLWSPRPSSDGLGRSLFAGPLNTYCPHFVVSSILKSQVNMPETIMKMFEEVRCADTPCHRAVAAASNPNLSSPIPSTSPYDVQLPENVLIMADIDELSVKVISSEGFDEVTSPPEVIVSMFESFVTLYNDPLNLGTDFILSCIEDELGQIVGKSLTLVEMVARDGEAPELTPERVRTIVGCDYSDLRLIVNVAAVYCPPVLSSVFG